MSQLIGEEDDIESSRAIGGTEEFRVCVSSVVLPSVPGGKTPKV